MNGVFAYLLPRAGGCFSFVFSSSVVPDPQIIAQGRQECVTLLNQLMAPRFFTLPLLV